METIRSFIAIELPEGLKNELGQLQAKLKTGGDFVKWVSPDSIHLTLKFLGDIAEDKVPEINGGIIEAAAGISPFTLNMEGIGVFPNLNRIQVIWAGLTGDLNQLLDLQKKVEENMFLLGYPEEERKFTPHLTLGRVRYQPPPADRQKFAQALTGTIFKSRNTIDVKAVNLMKSRLTPQGAIYTELSSTILK
jgi:RNA 2',3'-cyclic 3'-phosphodiesterase